MLAAQPVGPELARRLAETDLDALTPTELFHYVRAAQRLASWAESLREDAVRRYCGPPDLRRDPSRAGSPTTQSRGTAVEPGDQLRGNRT